MRNNPDDDLLHDVLGDAASPAFRDDLLQDTLHQVRRRKQWRRVNRGLGTVACVIALLLIAARFLPHPTQKPQGAVIATSDPLIVRSSPSGEGCVIATDSRSVEIISSSMTTAMVQTLPPQDLFKTIGDDELLASLQGTPAVLVRHGPFDAELVFANPEDMKGFPVH